MSAFKRRSTNDDDTLYTLEFASAKDEFFERVIALLLLCVLLLGALMVADPAQASMEKKEPTQDQLIQLYTLEPYIRYFTSLTYGPNHARVSPAYMKALILTESAGDPYAHSSKGARGLTQILPATARKVVRELAAEGYNYLYIDERVFDDFDADALYDPAVNILIACYLNATYHDEFEGRTDLVAAAWNAGPGAVKRYGNEPPPYVETRALITRILGYMTFFEAVRVR